MGPPVRVVLGPPAAAALLLLGGCYTLGAPGSEQCSSYTRTTVAAMRTQLGQFDCPEMNVVVVARTSSATDPRLFLQDPGGGDFSAIMGKCVTTDPHACSAASLATALKLTAGSSIVVRGGYHRGRVTGFEELSIEEIVDKGTTGPIPPPIALNVADLAADARTTSKWFQEVTAEVPPGDPLVVYDFSPPEFQRTTTPPCPIWLGFAMIPKSAGVSAAASCLGGSNPGSRAPGLGEILIGRNFFHTFNISSDCACAAAHNQILLTPASTVSGKIAGILSFETKIGATTGYQVFLPVHKSEFPVK